MKTHSKAYYYLFIFIILLPIVHSKTLMQGMLVPRVLSFWFLIEIALLTILIKYEDFKIKKSSILIGLTAILIIGFISSLFATSPFLAFFSTFERMNGFVLTIFLVVFYIIFGNVKFNQIQWKNIALLSLIVAIGLSIWGLKEAYRFDNGRVESTLSNPLFFAVYLQFNVFVAFILLYKVIVSDFTKIKKIGFASILLLCISFLIYTIINTKSRSSFLAVLFGLGVSFFLALIFQKKYRNLGLILTFIFVILSASIFIFKDSDFIKKSPTLGRITDFSRQETSINSRINIWKMSVEGLKDFKIFGWGKENFDYFYAASNHPKFNGLRDGLWYDRAHNIVIDKLVEEGILGLLAYLFFLIMIFYQLWKKSNIDLIIKCLLTGSLVAYCFYNLFVFEHFISFLFLFIILIYIEQYTESSKDDLVLKINIKTTSLIVAVIVLSTYFLILKTFQAEKSWTKASKSQDLSSFIKNYKNGYESALIGNYDIGIDFIIQKDRVALANIDNSTKDLYFREAENQAMNLFQKMPNHPVILTYLGLNYLAENQNQKAITTYENLQKVAPNRSVNLIDLAVLYVNNKEFDRALKIFDTIYQNNKKEEIALLYKAYTMAMRGDKTELIRKEITKCKTETFVENISLVYLTCENARDLQFLADNILNSKEKEKFTQNVYYYWLKANTALNDKTAIGGVLYAYDKAFTFGKSNFYLVKEIADGVYNKTIQPEKLQEYFVNYPNK